MSPEYYLVGSLVLAAFSIPAVLSAWIDGRSPWRALIVVLIATGLFFQYTRLTDNSLSLGEITTAFAKVIGDLLR